MSGSYTNTDGRSESFNAGAAHETGLYDPNRHDNQIVAVYENRPAADAARDALLGAGIPASAVQVLDRTQGDAAPGASRVEDRGTGRDEGFWGAIKSLFVPDEDYTAYYHAIDRGHAMVMVIPAAGMDRHRVIEILESSGPIDFDAKLEEWRQAGYDYSQAPRAPGHAAGAAEGMGTSGSRMMTETVSMPETGATRAPTATAAQGLVGEQETVKVVEERLRVGKREVAQGAVRVRSYVVERPVEEQVRLHEERITLERRPVDRPATEADAGLFQERTIEARSTAEEAVVSKEARVVEEIGIRKEAQDRTETVRETVRETKVEVEDETGRAGTMGGPGTTGRTQKPRR
ncbi:MAG TPA: YsnF/AvaK domain-containing protein [Acetobacteraceae bacterium]|jgi:uncharacterized protein (TIGR02271 family)|nr:YsnF/AvaK domain-containing protein [Acetobacteraceae bacterium]